MRNPLWIALALILALTLSAVGGALAESDSLDALKDLVDSLSGDTADPAPDGQGGDQQSVDAPADQAGEAPDGQTGEASGRDTGFEDYQLMQGYAPATLNDTVLVQVPMGWGNNAGASNLTSYSPVNGSGAMSPNAGTISTNWFSAGEAPGRDVLRDYAERISSKKVISGLQAEDVTVVGQPGSLMTYSMDVGANHFDVNLLCFAYQGSIYVVDLTQGARSQTDYRPVFDDVSGSLAIYDDSWDIDALIRRAQPTPEPAPTAEPATPEPTAEPATPEPTAETALHTGAPAPGAQSDLGGFTYAIDGRTYVFPTRLGDMDEGALPIDRAGTLPYDLSPAAADNSGTENPLVNTQFYAYDDPASMELVGLTNLTGGPTPLSEGMVTALVDTPSGDIRLTLPGDVAIGSPESAIIGAFPEFSGRALDGLAGFRGNELLYACNVRSDGSHGYALIRNDPPYYSALTLVCTSGQITEINFECLGQALANGIFL